MALAFSTINEFVANSITVTVPTNNPVVLIGIAGNVGTDNLTSVTLAGVAATFIGKVLASGTSARYNYLYGVKNPPTGSQTVATTWSSGALADGFVISYTGASPYTQFEGGATNSNGNGSTTLSVGVTTATNNDWVTGFFASDNGNIITAGSSATARSAASNCTFLDSNAVITPAGSFNLNAALSGGTSSMAGIAVGIVPFPKTTFLEPGGDADFQVTAGNGFWSSITGTVVTATDFVHGGHQKSLKYAINGGDSLVNATNILSDTGSRISLWVYFNVLPASVTSNIFSIATSTATIRASVRITSGGVLQLWQDDTTAQMGSNGPALITGRWYRISLAYTITSTTVNRFELFVNGVSAISVTNATLTSTGTVRLAIGTRSVANDTIYDFRSSDHYVDNSSSLTDTGNIWVTAKRPNSNGTTNGFTTQIGSGGSGYGTGHSPQVNERPLSTTNGWSMVGAGSAVTEEYNIESQSTGDIDISTGTVVDWLGWASMSSLVGETVNMILNGTNIAQAITSTATLYTQIKSSSSYPSGAGADIGIQTSTALTTVSLYESGVIVAFIPAAVTTTSTSSTSTSSTSSSTSVSTSSTSSSTSVSVSSTSSSNSTSISTSSTSTSTSMSTSFSTSSTSNSTSTTQSFTTSTSSTSFSTSSTSSSTSSSVSTSSTSSSTSISTSSTSVSTSSTSTSSTSGSSTSISTSTTTIAGIDYGFRPRATINPVYNGISINSLNPTPGNVRRRFS